MRSFDEGLEGFDDLEEEDDDALAEEFLLRTVADDWKVVEAGSGYIGLAPIETSVGDVVCVPRACSYPLILRPMQDHLLVVGPCVMPGLMDGEAKGLFESGLVGVEMLELR